MTSNAGGSPHFTRAIYFDRYTLAIVRQKTFAPSGDTVSETRYADWKPYGGIPYPSLITIRRPMEGYEVTMTVVDMTMNRPDVTPAKFVLQQPSGTQLTVLK
jgi:hypothetical protein